MGSLKKILIIYPHFPPSNLAGVHRPRLFVNHLKSFGWEPIILTVHEKYYEEALDWNLHKLLPSDLRIEKVAAYPITKPRLIGDIGLRAFFQLRKRALELLKLEKFDFVYIPIPSFYVSLIGSYLYKKTGVKYGIDYIDPWVHQFPGSNKIFNRHWFSTLIAKWLEPKAVRYASLITGVAEGYYEGVIERNPTLKQTCIFGAMPYGGESTDFDKISQLKLSAYLFNKNDKIKLVYAGAMLPKSYVILEAIFQSICSNPDLFESVEFYFIGTGKYANDSNSYNIKSLAEKYGLWNRVVFEFPQRFPYLDVLVHLMSSDGVFVLGSTESHYTPSKIFQGLLSSKPLLVIIHQNSTAVDIINSVNEGQVFVFSEIPTKKIIDQFPGFFIKWLNRKNKISSNSSNRDLLMEPHTSKFVTKQLVQLLNKITNN